MLRIIRAEGVAEDRGFTIGRELGDMIHRSLGFYRAPPGELGPDKEISHKRSKVRWFARPVGAHWQLKTSNAEL